MPDAVFDPSVVNGLIPEEELRAMQWRADQARRASKVAAIQASLSPPSAPYAQLVQNYNALQVAEQTLKDGDDYERYYDERNFNA